MAQIIKCPSCGAADYEKKDETHYQCNFCESDFIIEGKKRQTDVRDFLQNYSRASAQPSATNVKAARAVAYGIVIFVLVFGIAMAIFINSTVESAIQASSPGNIQEDEYWQAASVNKFYVFEGSEGAVIWMLLNQSSKGLDSAKYTVQLIHPKHKKVFKEWVFARMTWDESFQFSNYLSEMVSYNDIVYFLSDVNGINTYNLYRGTEDLNNKNFANFHLELKEGIVSAKDISYRSAIELMTNDGFKFMYIPKYKRLVSEEEFNDYQKCQALMGGFVLSDAPRQKLYYVVSKQDTLRSDFTFSSHYLTQYMRNGKSGYGGEKASGVDTAKVFFNAKYLMRTKNQIVFAYTENVDKKSKAHLISYTKDDFLKPVWKIEFENIEGFEKALAEDYYLQSHQGEIELAVWYESAKKSAFGVDLKSGKINWNYSIN